MLDLSGVFFPRDLGDAFVLLVGEECRDADVECALFLCVCVCVFACFEVLEM